MAGAWLPSYVEQVLVPTLNAGDVVIVDDLPAHRGAAAREAIEAARSPAPVLRRGIAITRRRSRSGRKRKLSEPLAG